MREFVLAGERRVGTGNGILSVLGLGSCVAIVLYDEQTRVGGLAHVLLPDPAFSSSPEKRWRFATTAIPDLLRELEQEGADRTRVTARLVGGACMFQDLILKNGPHIGERNVAAARRQGMQTIVHAIGDEANRHLLDVLAASYPDLAAARCRGRSSDRPEFSRNWPANSAEWASCSTTSSSISSGSGSRSSSGG